MKKQWIYRIIEVCGLLTMAWMFFMENASSYGLHVDNQRFMAEMGVVLLLWAMAIFIVSAYEDQPKPQVHEPFEVGQNVRHKKGGKYLVLFHAIDEETGESGHVYMSVSDGKAWFRKDQKMLDGRFTPYVPDPSDAIKPPTSEQEG